MLGEIETYCRDMHWSGSLSGAEAITLSHRALPGAGAVHSIIYGTGVRGQEAMQGLIDRMRRETPFNMI